MDSIQEKALKMALSGHNLLITGYPGTGKSFTVARIAEQLQKQSKNVVLTAITGKAAQTLQEKLPKCLNKVVTTIHKCLGLKDGRYTNDELVELLSSEESHEKLKRNVCAMDCLIIDEISMLSLKMIEQVQHVLSKIRQDDHPFGDVQMILCGDFLQLPPIANQSYNDDGYYCVQSTFARNCFHHVQLSTIHRQAEPDFIAAIHQIAGGEITEETHNLLKRLKRNLPPGAKPVKLYALNLDVEIWNSECLLDMEGELKLYEATDSGDKTRLNSVAAAKILALKKWSPVILIVNLSDELVNGLTGEVMSFNSEAVDVYFPSLNRNASIKRHSFTVYNVDKKIDVACRMQFPLRLGFALTVHKAQGLTLERVSVDCRSMHQYGQIAVALSRATAKKGLQVNNFSKTLLRKPPKIISDFYMREQYLPQKDFSCCRHSVNIEAECVEDYEDLFTPFDDLNNLSQDDGDEEAMLNLVESLDEDYEENFTYVFPESINIMEILDELCNQSCETVQQREENKIIQYMKNCELLERLVHYLWDAFYSLKDRFLKEGTSVENKTLSKFYRQVNVIMTGNKLKHLGSVFGGDPVAQKNVVFKLASKIRKLVLESAVDPIKKKVSKETEKQKGLTFPESAGGRGKIRYIGGWCISQVRKRKIQQITKCLYKQNKKKAVESLKTEINALHEIQKSESFLLEHSSDKESLYETERKQNMRKGLTNISDDAHKFFIILDQKIRKLETTANLNLYGSNFSKFVHTELNSDNLIFESWTNLFMPSLDQNTCKSLLDEILLKYCSMSLAQLRKTYLQELKVQKTEAHRKQIKMRENGRGKTSVPFNMKTITDDKTTNKIVSHKRLQAEILDEETSILNSFTKADLLILCMAYCLSVKVQKNKKLIIEALNPVILKCSDIPNVAVFNRPEDNSGVNIEDQIVTQGASESVSGSGSTQSSATEDQQKSGLKKTVKRKISKGKGKGEKKVKKSVSCKFPCGVCSMECSHNVVCCDGCDIWFHADCIHVENLDELPDEWFCNTCKDEMENMSS